MVGERIFLQLRETTEVGSTTVENELSNERYWVSREDIQVIYVGSLLTFLSFICIQEVYLKTMIS